MAKPSDAIPLGPDPAAPAVVVENLVKSFGGPAVLDGLSFTVGSGERYALLGPNGVGKTTLLKCLVGLYAPAAGQVRIHGLDRKRDHLAICRFTAWLPDQPYLYPSFTGRGWLRMIADIYDVAEATRDQRITELLSIFDLGAVADVPIMFYSNGQHKKMAVCGALVTGARLHLMDEPFTGEIDPPGVAALKEILRALAPGSTLVFSTQMVDQAEKLATRVGLLHGGRIVAEGSPQELCAHFGVRSLEQVIAVVTARDPADTTRRFLATLE